MKAKTIVFLTLLSLSLVLLLQNAQVVSVKFFFWEISMSRVIMFPLLILLGFALGYVAGTTGKKRRGRV
ncbi:MAG: LapA family protein [bacterium]|nr:MAG: LapA family protein [bacterium]